MCGKTITFVLTVGQIRLVNVQNVGAFHLKHTYYHMQDSLIH